LCCVVLCCVVLCCVVLCCVLYRLIDHLLAVSRSMGCYKVILDCNDQNIAFYEKLGFKIHVNHMANYFDTPTTAAVQQTGSIQVNGHRKHSNGMPAVKET